jgi:hypothetical protein
MKLTRLTIYTLSSLMSHAADGYAALFGTPAAAGNDERGDYIEVTSDDGLTIELRPVEIGSGDVPTVTRMEFRGADAQQASKRLHEETLGVQRHLYGGWWDNLVGNSISLIPSADNLAVGDWPEPSESERVRIGEAIRRGEVESEIERMNSTEPPIASPKPPTHHASDRRGT